MNPRSLSKKPPSLNRRHVTPSRPSIPVGPSIKVGPSVSESSSTAQQLRDVERRLTAIRRGSGQIVRQEAGESGTVTIGVQENGRGAGSVADLQPVAADKEVLREGKEREAPKIDEWREAPEEDKEATQADEGKDDGEMRDEEAENANQVNRHPRRRKVSFSTWSSDSHRCRPTQRWSFLRTRTTTTLAIRGGAISLTG